MAQHLQQGQALDAVLLKELMRMAGVLFQKGRQQLTALHGRLAGAEGVDKGPLHHPDEAKRAVGLEGLTLGHQFKGSFQHSLQVGSKGIQLHAAALQDPGGVSIIQQRQQQMFQGHILVTAGFGQLKGPLETLVQLGTDLRGIRHRSPLL